MSTSQGRVVLVSGGSRGLGRALVTHFLSQGDRVATFSRTDSAFVAQMRSDDPDETRFLWRALDGRDCTAQQSFVRTVAKTWAPVEVLINNAGVGVEGHLTLTREEAIARALSINLEAPIHLTRACLKGMIASGHGCIVMIGSVNGRTGHAGLSVYSATKAALEALTRSLTREVGPQGVRINTLAAGYFESDMTGATSGETRDRLLRRIPAGRLGRVEDMVHAVDFLVSPRASYVQGTTFVVDGGMTC
ncbi:MAG: SDR family oxidoreductase [Rhodobacteraceae bacterium]|nr:SDR family oxidoreductase [Paracoccaceae bacterium]